MMFWPASGPRRHSTDACPVIAENTVTELDQSSAGVSPAGGGRRDACPTLIWPPPWTTVKVMDCPSLPLQLSLTQARSGSGVGLPTSDFWLFPLPTLIWFTRAARAE